MDPMELLPAELWKEIFQWVKEAADWHNFYNTSPSFQSVVGPQRIQALFPQVLPVLKQYLLKDGDVLPLVELLPLRLVSHKWKLGVDTLFEGNPNDVGSKYSFDPPARISSFLDRFEAHTTSPFIGNTIRLRLLASRNERNLVMSLMLKFGHHLKGLGIVDHEGNVGDLELGTVLTRVSEVLQLAPTLESLEIEGLSWDFCRVSAARTSQSTQVGLPIIILPNLKSLAIKTGRGQCGMEWQDGQALHNALLRGCCSSSRNSLTEATVESVPAELTTFANLKCLSLSDTTRAGLSRLQSASWPTLSELSMVWFNPEIRLDMHSVFRAVGHFGDTLASLSLHIPFRTPENFCEEPLTLPRLKSLRILGSGNSFSSIDFLVTLLELEELQLEGWAERMYEVKRKEGRIKVPIRGTQISMMDSNIWELLARLRTFRFSGGLLTQETSSWERFRHVYSRDCYGQLHFKSL